MNLSFEVAKMEQERFYLNGWKAGALGEECPPGAAQEFFNGWHAAQELRAKLDAGHHLTGLRAGLAGEPAGETTCEALEKGREEGVNLRRLIAAQQVEATEPGRIAVILEGNALRQERADWQAASLNIRRQLAPLLGCGVDNEPADSMVGRMVALYEARDERLAEQRGHDKAMEWAAVLAGDFDPFSADWSDVERRAGECALRLFAEKLRREVGSPASSLGTSSAMRGTVTAPSSPTGAAPAAWAKPCATCGRLIWASTRQGGGTVLDAGGPHTCFPEKEAEEVDAKEVARVTGGEWQSGVPLDFGPPGMAAVGTKVDDLTLASLMASPAETSRWSVTGKAEWTALGVSWAAVEEMVFYLPRRGRVKLLVSANAKGDVALRVDDEIARAGRAKFAWHEEDTRVLAAGFHKAALVGRGGALVRERELSAVLLPDVVPEEPLTSAEIAAVRALLTKEHV